jgi:hypothetical protein
MGDDENEKAIWMFARKLGGGYRNSRFESHHSKTLLPLCEPHLFAVEQSLLYLGL